MKRVWKFIGVCTLGLTLAGCGTSGGSQATSGNTSQSSSQQGNGNGNSSSGGNVQYVIGADFPLSGPNATYGNMFSEAANLAVQDVNQNHILPNLKIDYVDSQALPQPAVIGFHQLVDTDHVPFVLSAFSGVTKALGPLAQRDQVVQMNGGGVSPDLAQLGAYSLNDIPLVNDEVKVLLPYLKKQGLMKMDVIYTDDPLGHGAYGVISKSWSAMGGTIVKGYQISPTASTFDSLAVQVANDHPDVVYVASYGNQDITLIKQLRNHGVNAKVASYSGLDFPQVISLPQAQGAIFTSEEVNYSDQNQVTQQFVTDFKNKYHTQPNYFQVNYYNAVLIYADAAKYLKDHNMAYSGQNILKAIHDIKTFDIVGGKVTFRADGTVSMPIQVNEIKGNKVVTVAK
ncbi:ABC transporter substrate-binding protein [Alicyclobacillus tolerans]|uniref:ABC transporter substrate-binding protein n=1 Tax=Alicyclobacillus tolerans TaxID=90970 RepID=UPI001F24F10C|nr:ABC transporter substrate-binding protein [Alicyclobacillus tolerans]MCF8565752.1 ABC transporter substrate-binding protein [Alicyclobacillus tolerans]